MVMPVKCKGILIIVFGIYTRCQFDHVVYSKVKSFDQNLRTDQDVEPHTCWEQSLKGAVHKRDQFRYVTLNGRT